MNTPTRKRHYTPEPSATNAPRQRRLRERRKADGWRRITVWLSPEQVDRLETLGGETWLGRTVKALLARSVAEPERGKQAALFDAGAVSDSSGDFSGTVKKAAPTVSGSSGAACMAEADNLKAEGLSWGEIARRWNDEGRRTERGAEFRGANIARDWRKWKGEK